MFLSQKNRNLIQQTIFENILPNHLKNKNLINKKMEEFYQPSDARPIIEINKSFLISYVKNTQSYSAISQLQEIKFPPPSHHPFRVPFELFLMHLLTVSLEFHDKCRAGFVPHFSHYFT